MVLWPLVILLPNTMTMKIKQLNGVQHHYILVFKLCLQQCENVFQKPHIAVQKFKYRMKDMWIIIVTPDGYGFYLTEHTRE